MQKEKQLVPKLRFPEFEGDWRKEEVKKYVNFLTGYAFNSEDISELPNDEFILKATNIGEGKIKRNIESDRFYSGVKKIDSKYRLLENDLVIGMDGSKVGRNSGLITINEINSLLIQRVARLRAKKDFPIGFIFMHINSIRFHKYVDKVKTSSGIPHISSNDIKNFKIFFPSLPEQQKIADFLSAVDNRIQNLEKKKELLEQYKKGITQKIFKQEIRFKDGDGKEFPEWEHTRLGEHIYKTGKKNKENIQYPIYSINNQEGFRPQSEQFEGLDSNERGYDISLYKVIKEKTFAYNPARINVGSIGYSGNLIDVIISSLYVCFKTKEKLEDTYLLKYLDTFQFNKDVLRFSEGGVRQYLFYENISKIKIPLPSNEEQQKIADFLSSIDQRIHLVTQQIIQSKTYKKGLLQQMFV